MLDFLLFTIIKILIKNIYGDPCDLRKGIYSDLDIFEECLRSITNYNYEVRDEYGIKYKILGGLLKKGYSKEELSNYKGINNRILNITDEILKVSIQNSNNNSYDYFKNIRNVTRNLRNGSCNFFPPYGSVLKVIFPFRFVIKGKGKEEELIITTHKEENITNYYIERMNGKDIRNKRVKRLWLDELEEIKEEDGKDTLKRWRDESFKRSSFYRDLDRKGKEMENKEGGREKEKEKEEEKEEEKKKREEIRKEKEEFELDSFSLRNLRWFDIPKGSVRMELEDKEGKIEYESIPYFGLIREDINSSLFYPDSGFASIDRFDNDGESVINNYNICEENLNNKENDYNFPVMYYLKEGIVIVIIMI